MVVIRTLSRRGLALALAGWLGLLGGACKGGVCDDSCLRERALEGFRTDYAAGIEALRAIQDPVVAQATVMDVVRAPDIDLQMPDQVQEVCGVAGTDVLFSLCMERYSHHHIKQMLDGPAPP
ncbi:MAG: hypothetical protein QGH45_21470 [Myxococcota bacterium]|jgi:hypothetical protein|nr:hypothetical protein [Myxococcota bacterium]